jgi:hypothetical protein
LCAQVKIAEEAAVHGGKEIERIKNMKKQRRTPLYKLDGGLM